LATDWAHAAATGGGVLSKKEDGREKVIEYWAKKLQSLHFIKHYRSYLQHRKVRRRKDHHIVQGIHTRETSTGMSARWFARWFDTVAGADFNSKHRAGSALSNASSTPNTSQWTPCLKRGTATSSTTRSTGSASPWRGRTEPATRPT
jgi:hypothetical protein